ncbi:ribonuclease Z [Marivirga sp. S37H4]|uniref:Ribonuclease Z n=1 Tax=Marivirga aurantiaca TaxID=2802615 RepID=A0A935CDH9_9BACT|nr:ribonuclease Z [Marivirga aurantiaca]MBK6266938.1 ribonuclease Z [Marivirga aurantiaca]
MSFEVYILGSNSAAPAHGRHHTSQMLYIQDQQFMVDCGEGAQMQMKKYGLRKNRLNHIFISHLHGDHYLGLMGLLSTMHLNGRKQDLFLYGPVGLAEIITIQLKHANTKMNYPIHFKELRSPKPELILENEKLTVHTIPLQHRIPCNGFLFREKQKPRKLIKEKIVSNNLSIRHINSLKNGKDIVDENGDIIFRNKDFTRTAKKSRSYAYCSDTKYDESLIPLISEVDLLYHEGTFLHDMLDRAEETFHTTVHQAATIAEKANVGQLIIGHFSNRYRELQPLLEEAKSVFENAHLAEEGRQFTIDE